MADYNYKKSGVHTFSIDGEDFILTRAGNPHDLPVRNSYVQSLKAQGYIERADKETSKSNEKGKE